jgi:GAF domain-containing protein
LEQDAFVAFCRQDAVALERARLYDAMAQLTLLSRRSG